MITVIGVGSGMSPECDEIVKQASLLVGNDEQLSRYGAGAENTVSYASGLGTAMDTIASSSGQTVVLASGDPGFFGIVRALAERFGSEGLQVLPAASNVATLAGAAGVPWDDALVVSAHGRDPRRTINVLRSHRKVAVLTDPGFGPAEVAEALDGRERRLIVGERLGSEGERILYVALDEARAGSWADPNVVLSYDPARAVGPMGWVLGADRRMDRWGLPEERFEHRNGMITKREVRAVVLGRLAPGVGDLVWDLGCGSGSVGVECARFGADVVAVDRDQAAVSTTRDNATAFDVEMDVLHGEARTLVHDLRQPDAVFIGGAGEELELLVEDVIKRQPQRLVAALASIERVAPLLDQMRDRDLVADACMLQASRIEPLGDSASLRATNPVFVVSGVAKAGA